MRIAPIALVLMTRLALADVGPPPAAVTVPVCGQARLKASIKGAKKSVAAVQQLAEELATLSKDADEACRVVMFKDYWKFYGAVQKAKSDPLGSMQDDDPRIDKLRKEIEPLGWVVESGEAGSWVNDGSTWLIDHATTQLPPAWRDYVTMVIANSRAGLAEDAALTITWKEVRERLRRWEDFVATNPTFDKKELAFVRSDMRRLLTVLLCGIDNSPAFDRETQTLDKELRRELEAYAADGKAASRATVKRYLALLRAAKWKSSPEAEAYLTEKRLTWATVK